jgi:hypothetical protein
MGELLEAAIRANEITLIKNDKFARTAAYSRAVHETNQT